MNRFQLWCTRVEMWGFGIAAGAAVTKLIGPWKVVGIALGIGAAAWLVRRYLFV